MFTALQQVASGITPSLIGGRGLKRDGNRQPEPEARITPSLIGGNRESQSSRRPCSAGEASFCLGKRKARLDRVETSWTMADGEGEATGRMESIADMSVVSGNRRKTGDRQ